MRQRGFPNACATPQISPQIKKCVLNFLKVIVILLNLQPMNKVTVIRLSRRSAIFKSYASVSDQNKIFLLRFI